jgi:putative transposase
MRLANVRADALHQATTAIVRKFTLIGIQDLNVRGMLANRRLARAIADLGAYEFRRQLEYKARMWGSQIIAAARFYPSSKLCSVCGAIYAELTLSERTWTCVRCRTHHDRDYNAAINLRAFAASSAVTACGGSGAGLGGPTDKAKLLPMKQKLRRG